MSSSGGEFSSDLFGEDEGALSPTAPSEGATQEPPVLEAQVEGFQEPSSLFAQEGETESTPVLSTAPVSDFYSLRILGFLTAAQQEKLEDLAHRTGIEGSRVQWELSFKVGRFLLPRVGEYVLIYWLQALRDWSVEFQISQVASEVGEGTSDAGLLSENKPCLQLEEVRPFLSAPEKIPMTFLPQNLSWDEAHLPTDALWVSALFRRPMPINGREWQDSAEFLDLLERLQRQLAHKAFYRKVSQLTHLQVSTFPVRMPSSSFLWERVVLCGVVVWEPEKKI